MKIIYKGRQCGKTYDLLEYASCKRGYNLIVCASQREVERIWKIILEKKFDLPRPITFDEFIHKTHYRHNVSHYFIDNLDLLLTCFAGSSPIEGVTFNDDEEDLELFKNFVCKSNK